MVKCEKCNHDCHCLNQEHIGEYKDICPCDDCECKDRANDVSYENEIKHD